MGVAQVQDALQKTEERWTKVLQPKLKIEEEDNHLM